MVFQSSDRWYMSGEKWLKTPYVFDLVWASFMPLANTACFFFLLEFYVNIGLYSNLLNEGSLMLRVYATHVMNVPLLAVYILFYLKNKSVKYLKDFNEGHLEVLFTGKINLTISGKAVARIKMIK